MQVDPSIRFLKIMMISTVLIIGYLKCIRSIIMMITSYHQSFQKYWFWRPSQSLNVNRATVLIMAMMIWMVLMIFKVVVVVALAVK